MAAWALGEIKAPGAVDGGGCRGEDQVTNADHGPQDDQQPGVWYSLQCSPGYGNGEHSGQDVEQIIDDSDRDKWFTANEAQEYGLLDHVITRSGELNDG